VETEAQLELLVARGCDDVPGNLFCAPCDGRETDRIFGARPRS
jgi:EAL domain-containing protein (putative c-di-GMP-specific phosphodiesterase class I)